MATPRPVLGYWPDPADDPATAPTREAITLVSPDGAVVRGILWTPPAGAPWHTAVALTHPRGDFSVHYACPLLAAAGYAVLGFATRYVNNDTDCLHANAVVDVQTAIAELRRRGTESVVLLGNSGGGSLMALSQVTSTAQGASLGDAFVALAAHPGEGVFMLQVIDPSVTDENDPFSVDPEFDMFHPDNGWRPWPQPCTYDRGWLARYREAQRQRVARIDAVATRALGDRATAREASNKLERGSARWNATRRRAVHARYLTIYRTMTARGWLSTWSGLSSSARLADTMPAVTVPTLVVHPTGDTEIRLHQAEAIRDRSGATDVTYATIRGAPHYLNGHRRPTVDLVIDWLRSRSF